MGGWIEESDQVLLQGGVVQLVPALPVSLQPVQPLRCSAHLEEPQGMILIHVHVHHLQETLHLLEVHAPIFILVSFLEPVTNPCARNQGKC